MIKGIGIDLLEKSRVERLLTQYGDKFVNKVLTDTEKKELESKKNMKNKISFISNNFSGKEAVSKLLTTGFSKGVNLRNIEVLRTEEGEPFLNLKGKAKKIAGKKGIKTLFITVTDTKDFSLTFVLGEGE